jgi:hypothetical protein
MKMKKIVILITIVLLSCPAFAGQDTPVQYKQVLTGRADKIVQTLNVTDSAKYHRVVTILVDQYQALGIIHDQNDSILKAYKAAKLASVEWTQKTKQLENETDAKLYQRHCLFIAQLDAELHSEQVSQVKNGMTYNVLNVTYDAQLDMIPTLKDDEKRQIRTWLLEAREHAMDASSSNQKHAWFGKYKGRINNYLAARGYDLTKERAGWAERIAARKAAETTK